MNYGKIDAPLGEALAESTADDEPRLLVFIHASRDLKPAEAAELQSLGVDQKAGKGRVFTATLSPSVVDKMSHMSWVRSIRLSQKLRPHDNG